MAIADTIQSMYTNVGNVYDTITNVTPPSHKNIENIPNTIKDSYLEIMNNGIDVVWNNWNKVTGTGTSFTLNNTIEAPTKTILKPSEIVQNGTPTPETPQVIHTISGENKVSLVGKQLLNKNNNTLNYYIDASGNPTSSENSNYTELIPVKTQTYMWNGSQTSGNANNKRIHAYDKDGNWLEQVMTFTTNQGNYSQSFTINNYNIKYIRLSYFKSDTNVMLSVGNQTATYEDYDGEKYPLDLGTKNLLNINSTLISPRTSAGVYRVVLGDRILLNGTATNNSYFTSDDNTKQTLKAGTYTLYTDAPFEVALQTKDLTTQTISNKITSNRKITFTFEHDFAIFNGLFYFTNGTNYLQTIGIYLVEGNETKYAVSNPIEYCKIGDYEDSFIRSTGKNLIDFSKDYTTLSLTTYSFENGIMTLEGNSTGSYNRVYFYITDLIKNNPGKILSLFCESIDLTGYTSDSKLLAQLRIEKTSGVLYHGLYYTDTGQNNYTIPDNTSDITSVSLNFYTNNTDTPSASTVIWKKPMLQFGTEQQDYEPYGNGWFLEKQIDKVVLNGSEEGWTNIGGGTPFKYALEYYLLPTGNSVKPYFVCDYYNVEAWNDSTGNDRISSTYNGYGLRFRNNDITTLADFKTWLSTHNTTVYYVLATPTYTKIEGTLANQLEAIYKAKSKNGQTNVMQENTDLPFIINMSALV